MILETCHWTVIRHFIKQRGVANQMEVCRHLNGLKPNECHRIRHLPRTDQTAAHKGGSDFRNCQEQCRFGYNDVRATLKKMESLGILHHEKRRFWDRPPAGGKTENQRRKRMVKFTDTFCFYWVDPEAFEKQIRAQTLEPYMEV